MAIVRNDPLIRMKLGGDKLTASVNLAKILRERAEKKHFEDRIDGAVDKLIDYELGTYGDSFKKLSGDDMPITFEKGKLDVNMGLTRGTSDLAFTSKKSSGSKDPPTTTENKV